MLLTYRVFGWRCGASPVGADPLLVCLDEGQRERSGSRREYSPKMRVRSARQISRDGANPSGFRPRPSRPSSRPCLVLVVSISSLPAPPVLILTLGGGVRPRRAEQHAHGVFQVEANITRVADGEERRCTGGAVSWGGIRL